MQLQLMRDRCLMSADLRAIWSLLNDDYFGGQLSLGRHRIWGDVRTGR